MKLCKDCKWHSGGLCVAPENMDTTSLVDGKKEARWLAACDSHRGGAFTGWLGCRIHKLCGREARWFTPRTTP